jgi:hypothetical protein
MRSGLSVLALACLASACATDDGRGASDQLPGIGSASGSATQGSESEGDSDAESGDPDDGEGPNVTYDVGVLPDGDDEDGCKKVDFLFVIDNSASMGDDQQNLIHNWPNFISGIQNDLAAVQEYQVGIVTSDRYEYNVQEDDCGKLPGLVVKTGGPESSHAMCGPYADGANFMTEQDDLEETFSCAAMVGTDGDPFERPMQALVETVQEGLDQPGKCNEGYLRDDSLLVITIITDEWDGPGDLEQGPSKGDPNSWFADVVTARGGVEENIVVLALTKWQGGPCPPYEPVYDGVHIKSFTDKFTYGFAGGICEPDWSGYFAEAIDVVQEACAGYVPP